jgi:hypothetical protein
MNIDQRDIDNLTKAIQESAQKEEFRALGARENFCKVWPAARQGLEILKDIISVVPGVSIFAKGAIAVVIAAGDAASGALCKS